MNHMTTDSLMETPSMHGDAGSHRFRCVGGGDALRSETLDLFTRTMAAFANGRGGALVVDPAAGPDGPVNRRRQEQKRLESQVLDVAYERIHPAVEPLVLSWQRLAVEGGEARLVLRVTVERSFFVHRVDGRVFTRVGGENVLAPPAEVARLERARTRIPQMRFEQEPVAEARLTDLHEGRVQRFAPISVTQPPEEFLAKSGLSEYGGSGPIRPTVAGVLMGCTRPAEFLPSAFVQAVAYRGKDITAGPGYQLDAADLHGPLDEQVVAACRFVAKNMRVSADKTAGRTDHPQFDITAVFEAMVNAVAHRDYAMHGTSIRLRQFADRIELSVPGSLVNSMTLEDLPYQQHARNPVLNGLLARTPVPGDLPWLNTGRTAMMDRRGEGVPVILALGEAVAGRKPEYALTGTSAVRLTLFARPDPAEGEAFDA